MRKTRQPTALGATLIPTLAEVALAAQKAVASGIVTASDPSAAAGAALVAAAAAADHATLPLGLHESPHARRPRSAMTGIPRPGSRSQRVASPDAVLRAAAAGVTASASAAGSRPGTSHRLTATLTAD